MLDKYLFPCNHVNCEKNSRRKSEDFYQIKYGSFDFIRFAGQMQKCILSFQLGAVPEDQSKNFVSVC